MRVILKRPALISIILASVETFRKECFLVLLGQRQDDRFVIEQAVPLQTVRRKSIEIHFNRNAKEAWSRMSSVASQLFQNAQLIGDCHSHTELYPRPDRPEKYRYAVIPSQSDKDSAVKGEIYLIVGIWIKKTSQHWRKTAQKRAIAGTLGKYRFEMRAFWASDDKKLEPVTISCPSVYRLK